MVPLGFLVERCFRSVQITGMEKPFTHAVGNPSVENRSKVASRHEFVSKKWTFEQIQFWGAPRPGRFLSRRFPTFSHFPSVLCPDHTCLTDKHDFPRGGHAGIAATVSLHVVKELARMGIKPGRHGSTIWNLELSIHEQEVTLWRQPGFLHVIVVKSDRVNTVHLAIRPFGPARLCVHGVDEYTHRRRIRFYPCKSGGSLPLCRHEQCREVLEPPT